MIFQDLMKEKVLNLKKERKFFLKEMILECQLIPIIQNILVKKESIIHHQMEKEKNLILEKGRRNLKIEADLNHFNLKSIVEIGINLILYHFLLTIIMHKKPPKLSFRGFKFIQVNRLFGRGLHSHSNIKKISKYNIIK